MAARCSWQLRQWAACRLNPAFQRPASVAMAASASAWCRGSLCSISASGSTSRVLPCQAAELTGSFTRREDWGCNRTRKPFLYCLKTSMPDQRHPVKAVAFRATASRLAALTGCRRPGEGLPSG
jgi:hypothetical protein